MRIDNLNFLQVAGASPFSHIRDCALRKIHFLARSLGMVLIDTGATARASDGKDSALRDWVRALDAIAPIATHPQRLLPDIIDELARAQSDAPALLSAR